mmetsp:Transcript_17512/g.48586  ORF Transcript_17512/g.48586 Transcript_17512/m.48586 type:complete len:163 (+) Transcript_17512:19-507(+)
MDIIQRLIDKTKPIVNIQNNNGDTLLHLAYEYGGISVARDLIGDDSVDATLQNNNGDTLLHCVCRIERRHTLKHMKLLIESNNVKVDVNARNKEGDTVLHRAIIHGCLGLAKYLANLERVDPHVRNNDGKTALQCAQERGHDSWMLALLKAKMHGNEDMHER